MLDNLPSQIFNWEKLEFKEHKHIMGVDFSSDNDVNSYTLARVVDGVIEFLLQSTTDETFFESEVKILTDLFNADIIKLNKNKMSENQLTILQMETEIQRQVEFNLMSLKQL
jgi:hypothetical protein